MFRGIGKNLLSATAGLLIATGTSLADGNVTNDTYNKEESYKEEDSYNEEESYKGEGINIRVGTEGINSGALISGEEYFLGGNYLKSLKGEEENGFCVLAGRNSNLVDVQAACESLGDYSLGVASARKRLNSEWLKSISANGYFGDVQGVSGEAVIPLLNKKNPDIEAIVGGYYLDSDNKSASGANIGLRLGYKITEYLGLSAGAEYLTDDNLTGDHFRGYLGLRIGRGNDPRIPYFGLDSFVGGILKEGKESRGGNQQPTEETYSSQRPSSSNNNPPQPPQPPQPQQPPESDGEGNPVGN